MTTWVLLRGLTRDSRHWGGFIERFGDAVPGARVVAVDLPGNGVRHRERSPDDVRELAAHCRAEAARAGASPPYRLLAMSLGAMVAVAWAHAEPQEVERCVLINTSLRPFSAFHRRLRPRNYPTLLKLAFERNARERERAVLGLTSRLRRDDAALLDEWTAFGEACPVAPLNAWRQLRAAARFRAPAERPRASLLLLASRHDGLVAAACSMSLARAWHCELRLHPTAGHDLPLDDGAWVAAQVADWLADTPSA